MWVNLQVLWLLFEIFFNLQMQKKNSFCDNYSRKYGSQYIQPNISPVVFITLTYFFDRAIPAKIPFTWHPYLKTDSTSLLILFLIKNFEEKEICTIFEGTVHSKKSIKVMRTTWLYRHSSIYADNVGEHKLTAESENRVNRGYLVVLKGR